MNKESMQKKLKKYNIVNFCFLLDVYYKLLIIIIIIMDKELEDLGFLVRVLLLRKI